MVVEIIGVSFSPTDLSRMTIWMVISALQTQWPLRCYLGDTTRCSLQKYLLDEEEDCGIFWNSIILDVIEKVDMGEEKELMYMIPEVAVDPSVNTFGAELSRRSQWICSHSSVFSANIMNFDGDLHYDHSDARYVYLSMCHDDAGTTTVLGIISLY